MHERRDNVLFGGFYEIVRFLLSSQEELERAKLCQRARGICDPETSPELLLEDTSTLMRS